MRATLYCQGDLTAPWEFSYRYRQGAIFYFLQKGACTIQVEEEEAQRYYAGDFVLIPNSHAHQVFDQAGSGCASLEELMALRYDSTTKTLAYGGGERIPGLSQAACG